MTTSTSTANGKVTPVRVLGVDLSKVDAKQLRASAAEFLGEEKAKAPLKELVQTLQQFFIKGAKNPDTDLANCNDCGGKSPDTCEGCPFCGAEDIEEEEAAPADKPPKAAAKSDEKKDDKKSTALVAVAMPSAQLMKQSAQLDAAVKQVQKLKGEGSAWAWKLGKYVREEIYDKQLWTQRNDEKGKPRYKGFEQFCKEELGFQPAFIYRMMEVSKAFTLDEAQKYGTTNLRNIISAPKEDQPLLLEKIDKEKLTTRGVEREVKKIREQKGVERVKRTGKKETPKGKQAGPETITAIMFAQRQTVKLFAAPAKKGQDPKPARRLGDLPQGVITCKNGVEIIVKVREHTSGQLVLDVTPKRKEED